MIKQEELDRLQALCDAATPGPWTTEQGWRVVSHLRERRNSPVIANCYTNNYYPSEINANTILISEARTAIPELIEEINRLKKLLSK